MTSTTSPPRLSSLVLICIFLFLSLTSLACAIFVLLSFPSSAPASIFWTAISGLSAWFLFCFALVAWRKRAMRRHWREEGAHSIPSFALIADDRSFRPENVLTSRNSIVEISPPSPLRHNRNPSEQPPSRGFPSRRGPCPPQALPSAAISSPPSGSLGAPPLDRAVHHPSTAPSAAAASETVAGSARLASPRATPARTSHSRAVNRSLPADRNTSSNAASPRRGTERTSLHLCSTLFSTTASAAIDGNRANNPPGGPSNPASRHEAATSSKR
ncbi:unnamed protein product [Zymoseptoria tritici ST99CH_3D1]|nr:unnamed protein product [Zymoseptoria tritici ST99CH_3D1]